MKVQERALTRDDPADWFLYIGPHRWWFHLTWVSGGLPVFTIGLWLLGFGRTLR